MSASSSRSDCVRTTLLAAAAMTALSLGLSAGHFGSVLAADAKSAKGKEKCYGVAKAGENGCQSKSGSHTCGGCSQKDFSGEDWKWVPSGTCLEMGGKLQPFEGFGKQASTAPAAITPTPQIP